MDKKKYKDGIYDGLSFEEYRAIDAVNNSLLQKFMEESPLHFKFKLDNGLLEEESEALEFGKKFHMAILEPDEFKKKYVPAPTSAVKYETMLSDKARKDSKENPHYMFNKGTVLYKEVMALFESEHNNLLGEGTWEIIDNKDFKMLTGMRERIEQDKLLRKFLLEGQREQTMVWTDKLTGIQLKGRLDNNMANGHFFADAKSCESANPQEFMRSFWKYGYWKQFGMYTDGYEQLTGEPLKSVIIVACEKKAPYYVLPYYLLRNSEWIRRGREWYRDAIEKYNYCIKSGEWKGYYDEQENSYNMYKIPEPKF